MEQLKPKAWHEQFLANADREEISKHLKEGRDRDIRKIAVALARECDFLADFMKLWMMRVTELDGSLSSKRYMEHVYVNKRSLYRQLRKEEL